MYVKWVCQVTGGSADLGFLVFESRRLAETMWAPFRILPMIATSTSNAGFDGEGVQYRPWMTLEGRRQQSSGFRHQVL